MTKSIVCILIAICIFIIVAKLSFHYEEEEFNLDDRPRWK